MTDPVPPQENMGLIRTDCRLNMTQDIIIIKVDLGGFEWILEALRIIYNPNLHVSV